MKKVRIKLCPQMLDQSAQELQELRGLQTRVESSISAVEEKSKAAEQLVLKRFQVAPSRQTEICNATNVSKSQMFRIGLGMMI